MCSVCTIFPVSLLRRSESELLQGSLEGIVNDFDNDAWIHTGRGAITPVRLTFHILQAVKYYIEDSTTVVFASNTT